MSKFEWWLNEPPPQTRKRTKDSRVRYTNLAGWLRALRRIQDRKSASWTYHIERQHFLGLPLSYIRRCTNLEVLEKVAQEIKDFRPPRGQRAGDFTTSLLMEVNNQIFKVKK